METIRKLQSAPLEVQDLIKTFIGNYQISQVTDIHFRENNTVAARSKDTLVVARNWGALTDENGILKSPHTFWGISGALFGEFGQETADSVVFRGKTHQIRCHMIQTVDSRKIFVRVQPLSPPSLSVLLKDNPLTLERITQASGLVLVCGPVGGGKTTTAASIVSYWATKQSRHIATIEDPVEYDLKVPSGDITSIRGNLFDASSPGGQQAQKLIRDTLRCDIDGLFIGEVRDFESRSLCLAFASTREPVVTTIHTGGFSDAIVRMTEPDKNGMDTSTMRMLLARSLHTIIYVDLAYSEKGEAVPVIIALPGGAGSLRNAIAEGPVRNLEPAFAHAIMSVSDAEGGISPLRAIASARQRGATAASIRAALPPDVSEEMLSHAKLS